MRIISLAALALLVGCVSPDLSKICPVKMTITQGVFGEVVDPNNKLEENIEVDLFTSLNGVRAATAARSAETGRGGYELSVDPSTYFLCAKDVCSQVTVPMGIVELSAVDAASGLTWQAPVAVPPAQMIGPCTYGD